MLALFSLAGWGRAANPPLPAIPANIFNVTNYGAKGDGVTTNTTSISNAISAAVAAGGGTVEIPAAAGTYLCGPINLFSSINLQVDAGATLQMLPYLSFPASVNNSENAYTFIFCNNVHDLEISGGGKIDGQGQAWWTAHNTNSSLPIPMILDLFSCNRLFIHDITLTNSPYHNCGIRNNGGNITISNFTESAPSTSPNTDGIDFVGTNCLIVNCNISVGDDNIALGSTGPLNGLVITNCAFGSGHGISIGSTVTDGITNLTVVNCSLNGTVNGIRLKCVQDDACTISNLNYLNISMTNVEYPIVMFTYYNITETPNNITPAAVLGYAPSSTNPKVSNITISNLNITSGGSSGAPEELIWGPTAWPISNLTLVGITNNAASTFELYNVYGVQVINSQFNFKNNNTFTLCNAGVTISNTIPGAGVETITGAVSTNSLAFYNASASMSSTNLFAANPIAISGGVLSNTANLTLAGSTAQNFSLGTNSSTIAVTGNLTLNSQLNITNAGGFTATNYTLFSYTGNLSGQPVLGATPTGFEGYTYSLNTNTAGQVMLVVAPPSPPSFESASYVPSSGSLILSGAGGVTNGVYHVLTSTNIALPLNEWITIATNQFGVAGNFIFTNSVPTNVLQRYFRLQVP